MGLFERIFGFFGRKKSFPGSQKYWETRYKNGGNSGGGSYGRLALFKAGILNRFVLENKVLTVIEWGCGDGHQLSLASYPSYIGLDVSKTIIESCKKKYAEDKSKQFFLVSSPNSKMQKAQLALSLDVIYHLVEDKIYNQYMKNLFSSAEQFVIIYSSDFDGDHLYHEKRRSFSQWVTQNAPHWKLIAEISNQFPYNPEDEEETSFSNFYIYQK